jgi:hypothetical protein
VQLETISRAKNTRTRMSPNMINDASAGDEMAPATEFKTANTDRGFTDLMSGSQW